MWKADIGAALADDLGKTEWEALRNKVKSVPEIADLSDIYKCTLYIHLVLTDAWDGGKKFPTLDRSCRTIVKFAQTHVGASDLPEILYQRQ
jgi:hypothetical protein